MPSWQDVIIGVCRVLAQSAASWGGALRLALVLFPVALALACMSILILAAR